MKACFNTLSISLVHHAPEVDNAGGHDELQSSAATSCATLPACANPARAAELLPCSTYSSQSVLSARPKTRIAPKLVNEEGTAVSGR